MNLVKNKKLDESSCDFNYEVFYGHETDMDKILDVIKTLPVMTENRLVVIKQAHQLRDSDWKTLTPVLLKPVPSTFWFSSGTSRIREKKQSKSHETFNPFSFSKTLRKGISQMDKLYL